MSNDLTILDNPENKKLLKETICKGANDAEFQVFIYTCRRLGLDPFAKQIYMVKRNESSMTIQTGVDGFRLIADRTGRYAPGKPPQFEYKDNRLFSATAYIMKQTNDGTWHEVAHTVHFNEYAAFTKSGDLNSFWKKMPCVMLAKCAECGALRKAFPSELSGIYSKEEMEQADNPANVAGFGVFEANQWIEEKSKIYKREELLDYIEEVAKHYELQNTKVVEELAKDDAKFNANFNKWKEKKNVIEVEEKSN